MSDKRLNAKKGKWGRKMVRGSMIETVAKRSGPMFFSIRPKRTGNYKPGPGRPPGRKNNRTLELEAAAREAAAGIDGSFEGDAHAFLASVYKNPRLPLELRILAASRALRVEKPVPVHECVVVMLLSLAAGGPIGGGRSRGQEWLLGNSGTHQVNRAWSRGVDNVPHYRTTTPIQPSLQRRQGRRSEVRPGDHSPAQANLLHARAKEWRPKARTNARSRPRCLCGRELGYPVNS